MLGAWDPRQCSKSWNPGGGSLVERWPIAPSRASAAHQEIQAGEMDKQLPTLHCVCSQQLSQPRSQVAKTSEKRHSEKPRRAQA